MNVIDLFCGCGGMSKGFEMAGFNVILGIDNDDAALNTFQKNHKKTIAMNADLSKKETFASIKEKVGDKSIDVIVGGPPCQGFSLSGPRNFDDPRNKLYLAMIETVKEFKPKAFVIENVPGMARLYDGEVKREIFNRFEKMGYSVNSKIVCAADFGVPQMRRRLIIVGVRGNEKYVFPESELSAEQYISCGEAISDLPSRKQRLGEEVDEYTMKPKSEYQKMMRKNSKKLYNHVASNHTKMVKDVIALVPEGGNHKDLPEGVGNSRKFNEAWTRYHSKKPSKTIDTGHRNHFHYKYNRIPTVRENARLQSFPDDFIFYGNRFTRGKFGHPIQDRSISLREGALLQTFPLDFDFTGNKVDIARQIGNAVPPLLGKAIAKQLKKYLGE